MNTPPRINSKPVDIARIALRRLTDLGEPPTPENYVREYRRAAGLAPEDLTKETAWSANPETVEMVRAIVQVVSEVSGRLAVGIEQLDSDSAEVLSKIDQVDNTEDLTQLLRTLTGSAMSLKQVIDTTSQELVETRRRLDEVSVELQHSQELARTDPLTGFGNRRAMTELVVREIARARRTKEPFSLAILDLDHFKKINDEYGHDVGDQALVHVAKIAKSSLRDTDELCRYGGEEFVVSLPGAGAEGAHFVMDRMRSMVERTPLMATKGKVVIRFSAGVVELSAGENAEMLLKRADQALYKAKAEGRNRVLLGAPHRVEELAK